MAPLTSADQDAAHEKMLQIMKSRSLDDAVTLVDSLKALVNKLRTRVDSVVLSALNRQGAIPVLSSVVVDDGDDDWSQFLDAQCTIGSMKGITTVRIMAGFVLSKVTKMKSALETMLDSSLAYPCKNTAAAGTKGSSKAPSCLDEILVWVRPQIKGKLAEWQTALADKGARAALSTAVVVGDPCAAMYEPCIIGKLPKKKPHAVLNSLLTMHMLGAILRAGTEDARNAVSFLSQPSHRYDRKIAAGKFPPWFLRLYLHGIRAGGVAALNSADHAVMPWHVHIEDLALVCMKSMEANAKLGSRLCNRGLLDMTSDHMIGAQSQLLSYPRTTVQITVHAMEDVFHRVVMAEALEEGAVRVAAKRAESVELKNRGNALVAEQQWKAALDTYNMAAQVDPDNYSAIGNASLCAFRLKRYRQGANLAVYALLVKPTWAKAWVRLAQCAEHLKFVSHLADFPVACVKMAMHLNPASTEEYEQALSVTHPSSEWCDVSGAVHNFRWMFIAQKAANVGYTFDCKSGLSQLAHLYLVTNAHNKCVVQRALKEDPSLRQHLKQCGMNVAQARGDVRMMTEIYTMLMRTAPSSVNDSIRHYEPRNLALLGRVGEVIDFMEQEALTLGQTRFKGFPGAKAGQRLDATRKEHVGAVLTFSLLNPEGNFSVGEDAPFPGKKPRDCFLVSCSIGPRQLARAEDAPFPGKKPHDCFLMSCSRGPPRAATECEIGYPTWSQMRRLVLSAAFGTRRGWVQMDSADMFQGHGLPVRIMLAHRMGYMFNEAEAWCKRAGIDVIYETRFAARDSSLGHGTHIDGFNDSEDEGSLVLPSGFSPGYKKYKWLLCSDEHNVPVAAAMGFTNSEKEAEGKFAAWHESSVRNTNRLHGNPME